MQTKKMAKFPELSLSEVNDLLIYLVASMDSISDMELIESIRKLTIGLPMPTIKRNRGFFYRGRINEKTKLFKNTKQLWYPELKDVRCNRFNDDKTQILYLSELKSTVINEVKPPLGAMFTILTCEPIYELVFMPEGISPGTTKTNVFSDKYWKNLIMQKTNYFGGNQEYMQIDQAVNKFFYQEVTKPNVAGDAKGYRFTNLFGMHKNGAPVDGILYSSITRNLYDINFAVKAASAKKLKITQIDVIKMDDRIEGQFELLTGSNDISPNGDIRYNNYFGSFEEMIKVKQY